MNQTDLTVLELDAAVSQLRTQGINPIQIHCRPMSNASQSAQGSMVMIFMRAS
jgi:hypothetical protein